MIYLEATEAPSQCEHTTSSRPGPGVGPHRSSEIDLDQVLRDQSGVLQSFGFLGVFPQITWRHGQNQLKVRDKKKP